MKGGRGLDRGAFKVTTVCYPTCCGHVTRGMEGMKARPSSPLTVPPSPLLLVSCFPSVLISASMAGAEQSSAAGHLALVTSSK